MSRRALLAVALLVLAGAARSAPDPPAPDPIRDEAKRRSDALVQAGFNMTRGFSLGGPGESVLRMTLHVPPHEGEHVISVWWETPEGEISMKLVSADGAGRASLAGRRADATLSVDLAPGSYTLEIDRSHGRGGAALLGFKGPLVMPCQAKGVRVEEIPADPSKNFSWPYLLALPAQAKGGGPVLVVPNNTGFSSEDIVLLRASAACEVARQAPLASRLGVPLLVPMFPRPTATGEDDNLYLHALSRAALETKVPAFRRVDLQLLAMLDDARARLKARGIETRDRALLWGFSASGSFVARFALLHPSRVLAAASGAPGGWPIAPAAEADGAALPYPVGIADVKSLAGEAVDLKAAKPVAFLFFLGEKDGNDSVPFRDSFSKADETLVFGLFGKTPVSRWKKAEELYRSAGMNARFALYPGVGHEVTKEMDEDVAKFFEGALAAPPN
jgi:dienelactone hydrolase